MIAPVFPACSGTIKAPRLAAGAQDLPAAGRVDHQRARSQPDRSPGQERGSCQARDHDRGDPPRQGPAGPRRPLAAGRSVASGCQAHCSPALRSLPSAYRSCRNLCELSQAAAYLALPATGEGATRPGRHRRFQRRRAVQLQVGPPADAEYLGASSLTRCLGRNVTLDQACSVMRVTGGGGRTGRTSERPGFSKASTRETLDAIGARIGTNTARAELVTQGDIAVYDLRGLWVIARIAQATEYLADFTTEVKVA